jgi:hypothetical protein
MLSVNFKIQNLTRTGVIIGDLVCAAHAEHRNLVYTAFKEDRHVGISYIGMQAIGRDNIEVLDVQEFAGSDVIREANSYLIRHKVRVAREFSLLVGDALVTDVTTEIPSGGRKPLFYAHRFDHTITSGSRDTVRIRDRYLQDITAEGNWELHFTLVKADPATYESVIFHDLETEYDLRTYSHKIFYVEYTDDSGIRRLELLKSESVYRKAKLEDGINFNDRTYTVQKGANSYDFTILRLRDDNGAMVTGPWYVRPEQRHQIKAEKPVVASQNKRWSLSITDASIVATQGGTARHYSIPEYHLQSFMPNEPRKFSESSECFILSDHLVVLPFRDLLNDSDNIIDILITGEDLKPKMGFTTADISQNPRYWTQRLDQLNPEHTGFDFRLQSANDRGVSFNAPKSLCYVPATLSPDDRVFIRAFYNEFRYEFTALNLNPIQNPRMVDTKSYVYIVPENGTMSLASQLSDPNNLDWQGMPENAVHYMTVDREGHIIAWSDFRLSADVDGRYDERTNLEAAYKLPNGDFTNELAIFKSIRPEVLFVSSVSVRRRQTVDDIAFIDIRELGGRLTDKVEENLIELVDREPKMPEMMWVSESSLSERPIPLHGVAIVKLPFEILDEVGGEFSRDAVKEIVQRHFALGSLAIIEYYGERPRVIDIVADTKIVPGTATTLPLTWTDNAPSLFVRFEAPRLKSIEPGYFDPDSFTWTGTADRFKFLISAKLPMRDLEGLEQVSWREVRPDANGLTRDLLRSGIFKVGLTLPSLFSGAIQDELYVKIVPIINGNEGLASEPFEVSLFVVSGDDYIPRDTRVGKVGLQAKFVLPPSVSVGIQANLVAA